MASDVSLASWMLQGMASARARARDGFGREKADGTLHNYVGLHYVVSIRVVRLSNKDSTPDAMWIRVDEHQQANGP